MRLIIFDEYCTDNKPRVLVKKNYNKDEIILMDSMYCNFEYSYKPFSLLCKYIPQTELRQFLQNYKLYIIGKHYSDILFEIKDKIIKDYILTES